MLKPICERPHRRHHERGGTATVSRRDLRSSNRLTQLKDI